MPKLHPVKCVALESDEAVDPAAWDQALGIICRLLIDEYFARRSKSVRASLGTPPVTHTTHPSPSTPIPQVTKKDELADSEDPTGCA